MRRIVHNFVLVLLLVFLSHQVVGWVYCPPGVTKVENPDDCKHSIRVMLASLRGRATLVKCPPGKKYNPRLGYCECNRSGTVASKCWPDGKTSKPHPNNRSSYYRCTNGRIILVKCQTGKYYNSKIGRCDSPSRTNQVVPAKVVNMDCTSNTNKGWPKMYQNSQDCTTYYTCNQGRPVLTHCPRGLNFNPKRGGCDDTVQPGCKPKNPRPINYQVYEKST